jgi:uncharacterized protein
MGLAMLLAASEPYLIGQAPQGTGGPSFPCEKARTATEKLICAEEELSALDLEYSRVYAGQLQASTPNGALSLKSSAKYSLQSRDGCVNDKATAEFRTSSIDCVARWYYWRLAALSELPPTPPDEWSPRLIGGADTFASRNSGLPQTQAQKPLPTLYFKPIGVDKFFKWLGDFEGPSPASMDRSDVYRVYQNMFGSLTYVHRYGNDGGLDESYFFNKDGRLAAQLRRFSITSRGKTYSEAETVYYGAQGQETRRSRLAYYDGKFSSVRNELTPSRLERPSFDSFSALSGALFTDAESVDAEPLGICIIDLADGYGPATRILNFPAQPLEVYRRFPPPMSLTTFDPIYSVSGKAAGVPSLLGSLAGKKVYTVRYPGGLTGVLVERQADRFLPVLYVNPQLKIDRLEVMKVGNEDLLAYSTRIPGNGGHIQDWYFVLENGIAKSIHYHAILQSELNKILPANVSVRRGGRFDIESFIFSAPVMDEKAGECCGSAEIVLALDKGRFVVKSSRYEKPK